MFLRGTSSRMRGKDDQHHRNFAIVPFDDYQRQVKRKTPIWNGGLKALWSRQFGIERQQFPAEIIRQLIKERSRS